MKTLTKQQIVRWMMYNGWDGTKLLYIDRDTLLSMCKEKGVKPKAKLPNIDFSKIDFSKVII